MFKSIVSIRERFSPQLRKVAVNTSWLFADRILRMGVGLFVGVWVARYLGPEQYGLYNYAIAFVSLFSAFATLGLDSIVVRDLVRYPACRDEILGTTFVLKLIGGLFTLLLTVGIISLLRPNETLTHWLVGITAVGTLFQAFDAIDFWFQSQTQSKYTVYAKSTAFLLITVVKVILIWMQAPLIAFACTGLAETIIGAVCLIVVYQANRYTLGVWQLQLQRSKQLLKESWSLILSGLTVYVYSKIDQVMLGSMLIKQSELGFYAVAVRLSEVFDFLPMILSISVLPKLTEIRQRDYKEYINKFQSYFDLMLILWLLVAIPVSLLAPFIVNCLYGESYTKSAHILSIYVWAQFGSNLGIARSGFLLLEGKQIFSLYLSASGAVLNVVLNLFLIPKYGAMGATIATLITYFLVIVAIIFFVNELKIISKILLRSFNLPHAIIRFLEVVK
ncbi:MAG: hypothetical protein CLLPBCKN_005638 [Chroococcidiopsis cubana SAG 39.79]|uniref:O-unit flippase n=1 Tax=Chroococcidiopsis cubana SAG 39.79 TaxID=388085 RepID=A0AB37UPR7_9CYAN|nr:flippase [Chroococcidiopsis cubana]MDZ4876218.1 hypothetical protein [Chroococcidiopsis cubana SAG 39.79]PSB62156.1 flippase [Chroococcidiopsis cubana CCALA 043]RUT13428.1 O-unit flippase [Chroococcidiopsis cubana SAG 39.79]